MISYLFNKLSFKCGSWITVFQGWVQIVWSLSRLNIHMARCVELLSRIVWVPFIKCVIFWMELCTERTVSIFATSSIIFTPRRDLYTACMYRRNSRSESYYFSVHKWTNYIALTSFWKDLYLSFWDQKREKRNHFFKYVFFVLCPCHIRMTSLHWTTQVIIKPCDDEWTVSISSSWLYTLTFKPYQEEVIDLGSERFTCTSRSLNYRTVE